MAETNYFSSMEPCLTSLVQCLTRGASPYDDPCDAYVTFGRICGVHNCKRAIRTVHVYGLSGSTAQLRLHNPLLCTVRDLKMCIKARMGIGPDQQRVVFGDQELDKNFSLLKDYGVEENSTVILIAKLSGYRMKTEQPKVFSGEEPGIKFTTSPDCISGTDSSGTLRALMRCGHAVDPNNLIQYAKTELAAGKPCLRCPAKVTKNLKESICGVLWKYPDVRRVAMLSISERILMESKLGENMAVSTFNAKPCPKCQCLVERANQESLCVPCPLCTLKANQEASRSFFRWFAGSRDASNDAFCWQCCKPWNSTDENRFSCGNLNCNPNVEKILSSAALKHIGNQKGVPSVRMCPFCGLLVCHNGGSNFVKCHKCMTKFCFSCLKNQCMGGSCMVAPRQA